MPGVREQPIHQGDAGSGLAEQHFIHEQRDQQRHGNSDDGTQDSDEVGGHQLASVR